MWCFVTSEKEGVNKYFILVEYFVFWINVAYNFISSQLGDIVDTYCIRDLVFLGAECKCSVTISVTKRSYVPLSEEPFKGPVLFIPSDP